MADKAATVGNGKTIESQTYELWDLPKMAPEDRALIEAKIRVYRQAVEFAVAMVSRGAAGAGKRGRATGGRGRVGSRTRPSVPASALRPFSAHAVASGGEQAADGPPLRRASGE